MRSDEKLSCYNECQQWCVIVLVGSVKRCDVGLPIVACHGEIFFTPGERGSLQNVFKQKIRHQPGVAAIAVGERMDGYKAMVKPDSDLVRRFVL